MIKDFIHVRLPQAQKDLENRQQPHLADRLKGAAPSIARMRRVGPLRPGRQRRASRRPQG